MSVLWFERIPMLKILPVRSAGQSVTIDGYLVPRVEVREELATGQWSVVYDNRFTILAGIEEMQKWIWLLAQAQAVGEGYSCHGLNSVFKPNPHQVQVMQIGSVQTKPTGTREG